MCMRAREIELPFGAYPKSSTASFNLTLIQVSESLNLSACVSRTQRQVRPPLMQSQYCYNSVQYHPTAHTHGRKYTTHDVPRCASVRQSGAVIYGVFATIRTQRRQRRHATPCENAHTVNFAELCWAQRSVAITNSELCVATRRSSIQSGTRSRRARVPLEHAQLRTLTMRSGGVCIIVFVVHYC